MAGALKKCFITCFSYLMVAFYGGAFLVTLLRRWLRDRNDRFWIVKDRPLPPKCLNDPAFGEHGYIQLKNVKLHYVHKGDPTKPLMLCVHGFPECWYSWRHQLKEFSSDYWVVAVDMRGYGDSEKPVGKKYYKADLLMDDIKNLVSALGKEKCTLVAHDWGGIVGWYFVLTYPQMVESYIIMNSVHPVAFGIILNRNRSQASKSWYAFFFQLPYLPELRCRMDDFDFLTITYRSGEPNSPMTDEDLEAFKFTFGKPGALTYPINYYRANFLQIDQPRFHNLGKSEDFPPGLVIFGERDIFLERELQEETLKIVANIRGVYISANHFVQQDNPLAVNKEMWKFFAEVKSKTK